MVAVRAAAVARVGAVVVRVAAGLAAVLLKHHHECGIHATSSPQHSQGGHAVAVSCRVRRGGSSSQGLPPRGCFPLQDRLPHGMGYRYQEVGAGRLDLDGNWRQQPHGGWLAAQPGTISASGASNGQILAGRAVMQRREGRCVRQQYGHRGLLTALGAPRPAIAAACAAKAAGRSNGLLHSSAAPATATTSAGEGAVFAPLFFSYSPRQS